MGEPLVVGFETCCDKNGVGVVRGHILLADAVASSVDSHARLGDMVMVAALGGRLVAAGKEPSTLDIAADAALPVETVLVR